MTRTPSDTPIPVQVAPATQRAYAADWHAFASWCQAHGESALPAEPQTVLQLGGMLHPTAIPVVADVGQSTCSKQQGDVQGDHYLADPGGISV